MNETAAASARAIAFPTLDASAVDALLPRGVVRPVARDDVLWREGDRGYPFYVVLRGAVQILESSDGVAREVTVHRPGEFTGDVDVLTGRASLVSARVSEPGEVLELDTHALQRVVEELPEVSEVLLRGFLMRRTLLLDEGFRGIRIIGSRYSPAAHRLREFASRNAIPYTWLDVEQDVEAETLLRHFGIGPDETPIVIGRGGELVRNPSPAEIAQYMGLDATIDHDAVYDLVVVGAGPAGLAASVYAASEGLTTLTVDEVAAGGQAGTSSKIENYLGFPTGISGADLSRSALLQAQKFGARVLVPRRAVGLRLQGGVRVVVLDDGTELVARCVIVASGASYRTLDVPRRAELEGAGVYYAATEMESRLCGGDEVVVVGGGNSAGQATMYLSRAARRVHVVIRGDDLGKSMSRYLVDRIEAAANVTVHRAHEVVGLDGAQALEGVRLRDARSGAETRVPARALFLFIGALPHSAWLRDCVALDRHGFVLTGQALPADLAQTPRWQQAGRAPFFLETSLPGIFAVGDVRSGSVKRVASAVGEGSMAVSFVHAHIGAAV